MKRLALVLLVSLVVATPAGASCGAKHRCHQTLTATTHLKRWVTPQKIRRNATLEMRVWVHGKPVPNTAGDGLTAVFDGRGLLLIATAKSERAPATIRYVANRKLRLRIAYWQH